ncbi:hypothetical protein NQ117_23070 [Paenibacillus sp. SC116]|nr:hypothetical protein [Paenibacillus sp. SC116]
MLVLILSLVTTSSVFAESIISEEEEQAPVYFDISKLDQKYIKAAEQAVKEHSNGKAFHLEKAVKDECTYGDKIECLYIVSKNFDAVISLDIKSAKVVDISLSFSQNDISNYLSKHAVVIDEQLKVLAPTQFNIQKVHYLKDFINKEEFFSFYEMNSNEYVMLDVATNKLKSYYLVYNVKEMDSQYTKAAQQAIKQLTLKQPQPFNQVILNKYVNGTEFWNFQTIKPFEEEYDLSIDVADQIVGYEAQSVHINAKNGKVLYAGILTEGLYDTSQNKVLTKAKAIAQAKPIVKNVLGVDISSYTASFNKDLQSLRFYKKGATAITVYFNYFSKVDTVHFEY